MDRVMADYLERKLRSDYARNGGNQGNRGNDYNKGNYNISGQYDNAGPNMYYPPMDSRPYPPTDMRNDFRGGDYNYPMDSRQGVKGTGPYGIGGSMYQGDRADFAYYPQNDMRGNDFNRGGNDYGEPKMPPLTKAEKQHWEQGMQNVDGTRGPHYDMQQVMQIADKMGLRFNHYSERDLAIVMNMFYSDYCHVFKKYIAPEKELMFYADVAKAYFDDPDGPEPEDKLSRQYHCMFRHNG